MPLFHRLTPEEKEKRKQRKAELKEIFDKAKFEAQKKQAKINGTNAGLKGNRSFMAKLADVGKATSQALSTMEDALGGNEFKEMQKNHRKQNDF